MPDYPYPPTGNADLDAALRRLWLYLNNRSEQAEAEAARRAEWLEKNNARYEAQQRDKRAKPARRY
jgi:hypothetical protein